MEMIYSGNLKVCPLLSLFKKKKKSPFKELESDLYQEALNLFLFYVIFLRLIAFHQGKASRGGRGSVTKSFIFKGMHNMYNFLLG